MAKENYEVLAEQIIKEVGGKSNVVSVTNCMTRLRFVLKDEAAASDEGVKAVKGVKGIMKQGGQYQVIIGTHVSEVRPIVEEKLGLSGKEPQEEVKETSLFNRFFKTISGCIMPMIGVMIAGGIIKGLLVICTTLGLFTKDAGTYQVLYAAADSVLYFMPIIVGFTAGKVFKCNPYVTAAIGAALVYPSLTSALSGAAEAGAPLNFLGIPITNASYTNTLFPILVSAWLASKVERLAKKIIPTMIQLMIVPAITLMVTVPIAWLAIGPVMNMVSGILSSAVMGIYNLSPVIGGTVLGAFWQLIVLTGLHSAFIPILINNLLTNGFDPVNAILGLTVWALAGVSLGYALKMKNKEQRAVGLGDMASCLCGVTEPTIYSICLPQPKVFVSAFIGGGIAGGLGGILGIKLYSMGGDGLFRIPSMINPEGLDISFYGFIICALIAFAVSAVLAFVFTRASEGAEESAMENAPANASRSLICASAIANGSVISLSQVSDPVFSEKMMGEGVAFQFEGDTIYAPAAGKVVMIPESLHAIGLQAENGAELLIHIGLETVNLGGKGFTPLVKEGDSVTQGQPLMKIDRSLMHESSIDLTTMLVVTNSNAYQIKELTKGEASTATPVLEIRPA